MIGHLLFYIFYIRDDRNVSLSKKGGVSHVAIWAGNVPNKENSRKKKKRPEKGRSWCV